MMDIGRVLCPLYVAAIGAHQVYAVYCNNDVHIKVDTTHDHQSLELSKTINAAFMPAPMNEIVNNLQRVQNVKAACLRKKNNMTNQEHTVLTENAAFVLGGDE